MAEFVHGGVSTEALERIEEALTVLADTATTEFVPVRVYDLQGLLNLAYMRRNSLDACIRGTAYRV
jgi:hypothetical protein